MKLYFFTEARILEGNDGNYYNPGGAQRKNLFERYLQVFSEVIVVARVYKNHEYEINSDEIVNSDNIEVYSLPYYLGPLHYLYKMHSVKKVISKIILPGNAYILRLPGNIGNLAASLLQKKNIPYGVEIVGDPYEVFSKNGIKHPLKKYFQSKLTKALKSNVIKSSANLYVTNYNLQNRYPSQIGVFNIGVSDVKIKREEILKSPKKFYFDNDKTVKIISIGSLDQMYKGPDVLIKAISIVNQQGFKCELNWVGKGKYLNNMKILCKKLGVENNVNFLGHFSEKELINQELDRNDIFILSSRTEGLPRVIIEAFARGLPVIGSNVGGIPELVDEEYLFESENITMLASKIISLIKQNGKLNESSENNLKKVQLFIDIELDKKRKLFFEELKTIVLKNN